jgi:predicted dienelactone hydrolase
VLLNRVRRFSLGIVIATWAAVASLPAWALPAPDGEHAVGVIRAEFVDSSRHLDAGDAASGPRRLPAIVWYPARERAPGNSLYMEPAVAAVRVPAIARNFRYAEDDLRALKDLRMAVRSGASPARHPGGFPVVVYSHGFFLYPEQNSALAVRLASHGYIVISIAHPGDVADVRLEDGRIVETKLSSPGDDPRFTTIFKTLTTGSDPGARREALKEYGAAFAATRLGRSFLSWRDDTLAVAKAIVDDDVPASLREVLSDADRSRLALAGMSFGGATSATTCKLLDACRAAVNLDGQNFDLELFDQPVQRPLLLMLSDWTRYRVIDGQPQQADFSPNDLAYERWSEAGENPHVLRIRLAGIRHMGFTDLVNLLDGPKRDERVGEIDGLQAQAAIGDLVLAFLDVYVRDGDPASIARALERHPALARHAPVRLRQWMR